MDTSASGDRDVFRPNSGRVLTMLVAVVCVVGLVGFTWQGGAADGLRTAPFFLLTSGACWAMFSRPCVVVDHGGVTLVNVLRSVTVPWPAIREVETRWGLTLVTDYGRFTAWAAPAPGAAHVMRNSPRREARHLPPSTYQAGTLRPGDLPTSASGGAALMVRTWWDRLRRSGALDEPRLEHATVPTRWHVSTLLGAAVLGGACVASLLW